MLRRAVLALPVAAVLAAAAPAAPSGVPAQAAGDMVLGRADAPVTVIEYASVTCPHCAAWHREVLPEFRRRFIDTGQVRLVFRELPTAPAEVATAGFLLARCVGRDRYFEVIERLMDHQALILADPYPQLVRTADHFGLSEAAFNACIEDRSALDALFARSQAASAAGVRGTPSFFIAGRRVDHSLAGLDAAVRRQLEP